MVTDFNQIGSEADEQIRNEANGFSDKSNLFVLVNKFDQKEAGKGDDFVSVKQKLNSLVHGIDLEKIYPVSARNAYLGNCAKYNLDIHKKLPDFEKGGWGADFGRIALGTGWEDDIEDFERCKKRAEKLWSDSLFEEPLKLINKIHSSAAEKSITSAMEKLITWNSELTNKSEIFKYFNSTTEELTKVTAAINSLENNINEFENAEKTIYQTTGNGLVELSHALNQLAEQNHQLIKKELEHFFELGSAMEDAAIDEMISNKEMEVRNEYAKEKNFQDFVQFVLDGGVRHKRRTERLKKVKEEKVFDPDSKIKNFSKRSDAEKLSNGIRNAVIKIFTDLSEDFNSQSNFLVSKMTDDISLNINNAANNVLKKVENELKKSGFELTLSLPELNLENNFFNNDAMTHDDVATKVETRSTRLRSNSFWGGNLRLGWNRGARS